MNPTTSSSNKVVITLVVLICIASIFALTSYKQLNTLGQDPAKAEREKITALVNRMKMIIDLPEGELPVLATVTNTAPLANNPFFAKAKVGDEVLIYPISRKAFLYDPRNNLILEVASLKIGQ